MYNNKAHHLQRPVLIFSNLFHSSQTSISFQTDACCLIYHCPYNFSFWTWCVKLLVRNSNYHQMSSREKIYRVDDASEYVQFFLIAFSLFFLVNSLFANISCKFRRGVRSSRMEDVLKNFIVLRLFCCKEPFYFHK